MNYSTAKKFLNNQSKEELIKIIAKLSAYSANAEEWLLEYCRKHADTNDRLLIVKKQMEHQWKIAESIIKEANIYGGTPDEDEAYEALDEIFQLAETNKLPWDFRQTIVDEMIEQFYVGNSGFEDSLIDACMLLCATKDEKLYLANKLKDSSADYYIGFAADLFLKNGKEDTYVAIKSKNLKYGSDYINLADYYKEKNQTQKAVALVEEALEKATGRMDEVYTWLFYEYKKEGKEDKILNLYHIAQQKGKDLAEMTKLMYEYYKDDYDKKKPYLLSMQKICDASAALKWYRECQNVLTPDDFRKESAMLHKNLKSRNTTDYLQVCIEEGNSIEALHYLQEHPSRKDNFWGIDYEHRLSKQLIKEYPKEVCDLYWNECESLCAVSNRKNYEMAVSVLKEIKAICKKKKMQEEWECRFAAFKEKHARKKILMGYLA